MVLCGRNVGMTYLDTRAPSEATTKLQESTGNLVSDAWLSLVVVVRLSRATREETAALGGSSGVVVVVAAREMHCGSVCSYI